MVRPYEVVVEWFPLEIILSILTRKEISQFQIEKERLLEFTREHCRKNREMTKGEIIGLILSQHPSLEAIGPHDNTMDPSNEAWVSQQKKNHGDEIPLRIVRVLP